MTLMQMKTPSISNVLRVFSRARAMPGLRPVNRDIADPRNRNLHQSGHALLALMSAMTVTPQSDKS